MVKGKCCLQPCQAFAVNEAFLSELNKKSPKKISNGILLSP
jgi:hypothetical protein